MTTSPIGVVLSRLECVKKAGAGYVARCPGHDDREPSLSVTEGDDGRVLLHCHANCELPTILAGAKLETSDLFPGPATNGHRAGDDIIATYPYVDENGNLLFEVLRKAGKKFVQRHPDARGWWEWNLRGVRRVLYRLPAVVEAVAAGRTVFVVEGEKDVHAVEAAGEVATCCPMGAGKWRPEYNDALKGADVVIVADADAPGRAHAREVAGALEAVAERVVVVESATHKDAADHLAAGLSLDELVALAAADEAGEEPLIGSAEAQVATEERELLRCTIRMGATRSLFDGAAFVLDIAENPEPVWADDGVIAWSKGEYMLVNGPTGVGKSTLMQQVTLARLGLFGGVAVGMAVEPDERPVLYLALDRPSQIARSFNRMVGPAERSLLAARLKVWRGPLPTSIVKEPELLGVMAEEFGAGTVIVDSLKDLAPKLSDEEVGQRVKEALIAPCTEGIEVAGLHHQRKKQQGGGKPKGIDDVYGSTFITAGAGSVLLLWGEPGDAVVELSHLKQPGEPVGPVMLMHDHAAGRTALMAGGVDIYDLVRTSNGLIADAAARALFGSESPDKNQVERARYKLDALVKKGLVYRAESARTATGQQAPTRYYLVGREPA